MRASFGIGSVNSPLRAAHAEDALHMGSAAVHVGMLPDLIGEVGNLNWFQSAPRRGPVLQRLLSKALPQRCQFRNFKDACARACRECPNVANALRAMVFCTLGGYYCCASALAPVRARISLYREWLHAPIDVAGWCERHPLLAFYALKEYLVYAIQFDPALLAVVGPRYRWHAYASTVICAMNGVRSAWRSGHVECSMDAASNWIRRYHSRVPVFLCRVGGPTPIESLSNVTCNVPRPVGPGILCNLHVAAGRLGLWTPERAFGAVGRALGWSEAVVGIVLDANPAKALGSLGTERAADVVALARLIKFVRSVEVMPLPQHYYDRQYAALCHRHNILPGNDAAVRRAGRSYACTVCRSFKGFAIPSRVLSARNQSRAFGHHKIAYDDVSGRLFCSHHKNERQQGVRPKLKIRGKALRSLGIGTGECDTTPCVPFSLLGNVVMVFGVGYTLCCMCGAPSEFASAQRKHGDWFCCGVCAKVPTDKNCMFCDRGSHGPQWQRVLVTESYGHECQVAWLCHRHRVRVVNDDSTRVWLKGTLMKRVADAARGRVT